jgi:tetratricopeptide (TPR) repeat protein
VNAEKEFRFAIEINPNYATAHQWYAEYLTTLGRYEEAIAQVNLARELAPLSSSIIASSGLWLYYAERYDAAIEQSRKATEMNPNFWMPHWVLGRVYNREGLYRKAIPELQTAATLPRAHTFVLSELGYAYARSGRIAESRTIVRTLENQAGRRHHPGLDLARIYVGLGQHDQALAWLEKGYDQRSMYLIWLRVEPALQDLHSDPRFADLVRRVGFPP